MKLTADEKKERERIASELTEAIAEYNEAVSDYNDVLAAALESLKPHIETLNEKLANAREFTEAVASRVGDYIGEKSEKWQESDAGQSAQAFCDQWEGGVDFSEVEEPNQDEAEEYSDDPANELTELPDESE